MEKLPKILQIIPAPVGLKTYYSDNGKIVSYGPAICLALVELNDFRTIEVADNSPDIGISLCDASNYLGCAFSQEEADLNWKDYVIKHNTAMAP